MIDWTPIWIAGLGIGGTLGGTWLGARFTERGENERWNAAQVAAFNVARAERLRRIYAPIAQSSVTLQQIIRERGFLVSGEDETQRDIRHSNNMNEALRNVGAVGGDILIESSANEVSTSYTLLQNASQRYRISEHLPAGSERATALNNAVEEINTRVVELLKTIQAHLLELDKPALVSGRRSKWRLGQSA
jgi:hypothetical protein